MTSTLYLRKPFISSKTFFPGMLLLQFSRFFLRQTISLPDLKCQLLNKAQNTGLNTQGKLKMLLLFRNTEGNRKIYQSDTRKLGQPMRKLTLNFYSFFNNPKC